MNVVYHSEAEHEEVKEWVLAVSMDQRVEQTLPIDARYAMKSEIKTKTEKQKHRETQRNREERKLHSDMDFNNLSLDGVFKTPSFDGGGVEYTHPPFLFVKTTEKDYALC